MKKHISKLLVLLIVGIVPLMAGCQSTDLMGQYVESYCNKPLTERIAIRATSATVFAPNAVRIQCASDYTPTTENEVKP